MEIQMVSIQGLLALQVIITALSAKHQAGNYHEQQLTDKKERRKAGVASIGKTIWWSLIFNASASVILGVLFYWWFFSENYSTVFASSILPLLFMGVVYNTLFYAPAFGAFALAASRPPLDLLLKAKVDEIGEAATDDPKSALKKLEAARAKLRPAPVITLSDPHKIHHTVVSY